MKILFDPSGLMYVAKNGNKIFNYNYLNEFLDKLGKDMVWVTSDGVVKVYQWLESYSSKSTAAAFMESFLSRCTVIPIRKETVLTSLKIEEGDLAANLNIIIAKQFNLDGILTDQPDQYAHCDIPILSSENFFSELECLENKKIEKVPFLDLKAQFSKIYTEIDGRFDDIVTHTGFIMGPHVIEFEKRFAELQDVPHCVGVSSGTAALHVALMALDVGPGDTVLLPVNTFIATAEAVSLVGALPVFVDCDEYYNLDTDKAGKLIEKMLLEKKVRPAAIIPVHLYGQPANMEAVCALAHRFDLNVIEDASQAHLAGFKGQGVGKFGEFGVFSFYPGKNLGAFGEAGALVTRNEALFTKAKMLRQHGEVERYHHQVVGHNYRMSAFQGAVLATKSKYIKEWTAKRQIIAKRYNELLVEIEEIKLPQERSGTECVYHLYVIQADDRDGLRAFLSDNGIQTGIHYPIALHMQEAYSHLGYQPGDFPVAESAAKKILSLPMYPELEERQLIYVRDKIKEFYSR